MTPFLKQVAQDIYKRFNGDLHNVAVVFPNKRAGLFFNEYLMQMSGTPIWSPAYITISELFQQSSNYTIGDSIQLVSKLYHQYRHHTSSDESIDSFYSWGELLIADFDDIDKNLADTESLFANLNDLRSIGNTHDALSAEQKEAIEQFFRNFNPQNESELKRRFLKIWQVLGNIYNDFKAVLHNSGIAYEGMMYRDIIENEELLQLPYSKYVFVGFNALSRVENRLFDIVMKRDKALFYWDYDTKYINDGQHEAARFMYRNVKQFPNALHDTCFDNIGNKKVDIISTSTDSIQMRYAAEWIENHIAKNDDEGSEVETAVILCDENKLESVYHIIPPSVKERNITMGFPVSRTPIYDLLQQLVRLQTEGYDTAHDSFTLEAVHNILVHPYIQKLSPDAGNIDRNITAGRMLFPPQELLQGDELLSIIFTRHTDNILWMSSIGNIIHFISRNSPKAKTDNEEEKSEADIYNELFLEAQLKVFMQTQRLITILGEEDMQMSQSTLGRLLLRIVAGTSIPFHGEPVVGMQIMGLLETRNLDFKNIIFISANEGNLPKKSSENSFIPYNLRRAFGLTLSEHRDSIYAYNFYRLLQRAEHVTLLYNKSTDNSKGECSRYILQLMADGHCGKRAFITSQQKVKKHNAQDIEKTEAMVEQLQQMYNLNINSRASTLSPSAINCYLDCSLRFFYRYIMKIEKYKEVATDVQKNDFGLIFHKASELFYNTLLPEEKGTVTKEMLQPYIDDSQLLYTFIDKAFMLEYFGQEEGTPQYNGEQLINREVLQCMLGYLVRMDAGHAPFYYEGGELPLHFNMQTTVNDLQISLRIGGRADRLDSKDGTLHIIDYKTGSEEKKPKDLAQVFAHEGSSMKYILQALLYSVAALESGKATKVAPSLIYIHKAQNTKRDDFIIKVEGKTLYDASPLRDEFKALLQNTVNNIFDINQPFSPTDDSDRCKWCDFKNICNR